MCRSKHTLLLLLTQPVIIPNPLYNKVYSCEKYIQQLETDHETDFYMGRCVRIDNKSFYFSLVNKDGKATCIFKIDYIQDGPFAVKKNITLIGKGN